MRQQQFQDIGKSSPPETVVKVGVYKHLNFENFELWTKDPDGFAAEIPTLGINHLGQKAFAELPQSTRDHPLGKPDAIIPKLSTNGTDLPNLKCFDLTSVEYHCSRLKPDTVRAKKIACRVLFVPVYEDGKVGDAWISWNLEAILMKVEFPESFKKVKEVMMFSNGVSLSRPPLVLGNIFISLTEARYTLDSK